MGGNDQRADANRANAQKSTGPKDTTSTRYNAPSTDFFQKE